MGFASCAEPIDEGARRGDIAKGVCSLSSSESRAANRLMGGVLCRPTDPRDNPNAGRSPIRWETTCDNVTWLSRSLWVEDSFGSAITTFGD